VERGDLVETVSLVGELQGVEEVRVFAQVPERIRTLAVREGDRVREGDLLATVRADLASEGVNQAQAGLEAAIANRDALLDNLTRLQTLASTGAAPQSQLRAAEAQMRAAEAQVRQASAGLGQAAAQKSRTTIRSPIAGVVAQITMRAGDLALPAQPIMTVVRSERMKVVLRAPERDFFRIAPGMTVTVSPLARPAQTVQATVTLKGPVVDRFTRTGLVEVELDNAQGQLVSGAAVRAVIEVARSPNVVLVPSEAVLLSVETERTGAALAFVSDGTKARRRNVEIGRRQADRLEVVRGLEAGESLVVEGAHLLRDGNPIRVHAKAPGAAR